MSATRCPHRPPCPGCPEFGVGLADKRALGQLAPLREASGLPLQLREGPPFESRYRARLAIRGSRREPRVGIFELGTHRAVDIPRCPIHHPLINRVAGVLRDLIGEGVVRPYDEARHRGDLRYVQVAVARGTETAQVVLVTPRPDTAMLGRVASAVEERLGPALHSLFFNVQPGRGNAIFGAETMRICGPDAIEEELGGARVFYPPDAFAQANMPLFARAVEEIQSMVPGGRHVLELYAGVGALSLGLSARSAGLVCNEIAPGSLRGLALGRAALPETFAGKVEIAAGSAVTALGALEAADVVLVDPPRKGLDGPVLEALCAKHKERLVYLSCGLHSFLRDAGQLRAAGYRLTKLAVYDFFPNTEHIETLACFDAA